MKRIIEDVITWAAIAICFTTWSWFMFEMGCQYTMNGLRP